MGELVVPIVEEQVSTGVKRTETDRVRVTKTVETREVEVGGVLVEEVLEVERVPVNVYVREMPTARVEGDVTVVPVVEEVLVVERRLVVREEVRIRKRRSRVQKKFRVPARRERVVIERVGATNATGRRTT